MLNRFQRRDVPIAAKVRAFDFVNRRLFTHFFENGMPTQINITLQFKELALLTKDKVKEGL